LHLDLFGRLSLYGTLPLRLQERLLLAAVYNDLRLTVDDQTLRRQRAALLLDYSRELAKPGGKLAVGLQLTRDSWRETIIAASEQLLATPGFKPWERGAALNHWLAREGACPLVHFAFERWFEIGSYGRQLPPDVVDDLADLSTTFLYRLVPDDQRPPGGRLMGTGAYSHVYLCDDGTVLKVPRNLAARAFASHDEHAASLYATGSGLAPFIPKHLGFEEDTGIIRREFVPGTMGVDLLATPAFREMPFALDQLEQFYRIACDVYRSDGINFDIHPGNIKWDENGGRWVLVDLGPMPVIGADYFPRNSFARYFRKIWLDLHQLMKAVPIRSLDIEIPAAPSQTRPMAAEA
jgi:hypothetical protein